MNNFENKMMEILLQLRDKYGVVAVKAEFEAEATRMEELMRLKDIVSHCGLDLIVKIGGAEAITDMYMAQSIGANGIIAPMIESAFAMSKYVQAVNKNFPADLIKTTLFGVNIETMQSFLNLNAILSVSGIESISTITVGRVDLSASMQLSRKDINSEIMFNITRNICEQAKKNNKRTTIGGGISVEAIPFIERLNGVLDRFETRKIVFKMPKKFTYVKEGIMKAVEFELLWLQNKRAYYQRISEEDLTRIEMIESRQKNK